MTFDNTESLATGVAVTNVSTQVVHIVMTARNDAGAQLAVSAIDLPAQGHASFTLNDAQVGFPVTNGKRNCRNSRRRKEPK